MRKVLREEVKYMLNLDEYSKKLNYLKCILDPDEHNGQQGYLVRSLYFDTFEDRDFYEKEMGIELRRKIRLRVYDPKSNYAYLEIKQKQGKYQQKRSLKIEKKDAIDICRGIYEPLLKYKDSFAVECYTYMKVNFYKPKVIVEYYREAFIAKENDIRITFDHNIRSTESNLNIFDENLLTSPVLNNSNVILEVKYNGFLLSYIKDALKNSVKTNTSMSKYSLSRNISHKSSF